ncbi:MAG: pseudouridine synthase [Alkalibacterium gilvum]|uniref:Pseudouridine synthase n=1 Tax=Alkalibacterium gilvum TaxID=1130080 RepID=A0A1H6RB01_9LACT|nr:MULTISPECIES: pseudouridine synthase [Alkalibacterium]MDN6293396.1 rRNA pseudouridine synthase [Alkalibacterium sp.]MDN6295118.1 rRNA pseudouridine synthase [Alkalibacterium sp.]MDN6397461.1 rRNA pseudouridine synthase [Alkalibacterium sp.]SEI53028.1 ribosomal small subunit pseudouridine synthase A [Alkalibacterium gilvum]
MRLDKLLAHSGLGTRKEVKKLLKKKIVEVNDEVIVNPKTHVDPETDSIKVGGESIDYQEFVYFMLNKPQGVISATEDHVHETVLDLLEPQDSLQEPHPVGRLDIDTEGLLVLTNDGKLTHRLLSPKHHVNKKYFAEVEGVVTEDDIQTFKEGITLVDEHEEFVTMPAELVVLKTDKSAKTSKVEVIIQEGKFHQVKRMVRAVGKEVIYLKRLSMGDLELDPKLELGAYRPLSKEEIDLLNNK